MKKYIDKFHYITADVPGFTHIQQAQMACETGAKWIQYRCLSKHENELLAELNTIAAICDEWGTTLIIADHYHLLNRVDAQGVHIEDMNADFNRIREIIGDEKTLGASANTFDDVKRIAATKSVDYIGCGPFAVTQTKPNSYSLLGIMGYAHLTEQMKKEGVHIPVLAVGGIKLSDVDELMKTGVYGIAVSAAINLADDPREAFRAFYNWVY